MRKVCSGNIISFYLLFEPIFITFRLRPREDAGPDAFGGK
jgi:hypothetical protein